MLARWLNSLTATLAGLTPAVSGYLSDGDDSEPEREPDVEEDEDSDEEHDEEMTTPSQSAQVHARATEFAEALKKYEFGMWVGEDDFRPEQHPQRYHTPPGSTRGASKTEASDWTTCWHQNGHKAFVRPISSSSWRSASQVYELLDKLRPHFKPYGKRGVMVQQPNAQTLTPGGALASLLASLLTLASLAWRQAINAGPTAREGGARDEGRRYAAASAPPHGMLAEDELFSRKPPKNTKHLLPVDHMSCEHASVRDAIAACESAALELSGELEWLDPAAWISQWASARAVQGQLAPLTPRGVYATSKLAAWTNVALYALERGSGGASGPAKRRRTSQRTTLGAHVDALNARYRAQAWLTHAVKHHRNALLAVLRERHPRHNSELRSRTAELQAIRSSLCRRLTPNAVRAMNAASLPAAHKWQQETTGIFNAVTRGRLQGGHLGIVVGATGGRQLPTDESAQLELVIAMQAKMCGSGSQPAALAFKPAALHLELE